MFTSNHQLPSPSTFQGEGEEGKVSAGWGTWGSPLFTKGLTPLKASEQVSRDTEAVLRESRSGGHQCAAPGSACVGA